MKELTAREVNLLATEAKRNGLTLAEYHKLKRALLKVCYIGKTIYPGEATQFYSPKTKTVFLSVNSFDEFNHYKYLKVNNTKGMKMAAKERHRECENLAHLVIDKL